MHTGLSGEPLTVCEKTVPWRPAWCCEIIEVSVPRNGFDDRPKTSRASYATCAGTAGMPERPFIRQWPPGQAMQLVQGLPGCQKDHSSDSDLQGKLCNLCRDCRDARKTIHQTVTSRASYATCAGTAGMPERPFIRHWLESATAFDGNKQSDGWSLKVDVFCNRNKILIPWIILKSSMHGEGVLSEGFMSGRGFCPKVVWSRGGFVHGLYGWIDMFSSHGKYWVVNSW